jgi:hypothetical protein
MSHMHERGAWTSGTSLEKGASIHKMLMTTKNAFHNEMFPKIQKNEDGTVKTEETEAEENAEAEQLAPAPENDEALASLEQALVKCGYAKDMARDEKFSSILAKAMAEKGEVVSERTGKLWVEREIPEEPPAFVRPDRLKLGDRVQVLNWVPMGVHGAKIDLFPQGKVSKIYKVKCLVTKEALPFGVIPRKDAGFVEEERILGLEIDGKGPHTVNKDSDTPFPYVTKDSSVIIRFPVMASPSGNTEHVSPMVS